MMVTKAVGIVDTTETDSPNGAFEVVLSAATLDRDGEVIDSRAFEPLPKHVPFDIDHGMTVMSTVGSGEPYYAEDGSLRVKGTFASTPLAQEVRTLVAEGHIRTTSVTFMAAERTRDAKGVQHVTTAELLNGTFTPVPSNREAVVLSAKALSAAIDDDPHTGASSRLVAPRTFKAIIGSLEAQRDRVTDALEDTYPNRYAYLRGVLPETVVFDVYGDDWSCETWQQTYTDDGSVVTLTGTPVEVDVMEVVTPDADASTEPAETRSADHAADTAAAQAAAESTAKSAENDEALQARFGVIENAARLAFGG